MDFSAPIYRQLTEFFCSHTKPRSVLNTRRLGLRCWPGGIIHRWRFIECSPNVRIFVVDVGRTLVLFFTSSGPATFCSPYGWRSTALFKSSPTGSYQGILRFSSCFTTRFQARFIGDPSCPSCSQLRKAASRCSESRHSHCQLPSDWKNKSMRWRTWWPQRMALVRNVLKNGFIDKRLSILRSMRNWWP